MEMLSIKSLDLGFNDAINYNNPDRKTFFDKIFVRTNELDKLLKSSTFFLLGEKGTGKTAYAVYLSNNDVSNNRNDKNISVKSEVINIKSTDYLKFISLKKESNLILSDYVEIWKVILYLIISQKVKKEESIKNLFYTNNDKFKELDKAIDDYNSRGFAPEISIALSVIDELKTSGAITLKGLINVGGETNTKVSTTENVFQKNLFEIKNKFEDALFKMELSSDHIIFIDGLDTVPSNVKANEYMECLKGLGEAVWSINNDFFSKKVTEKSGRVKIVLLMRPDIFIKLNLQNQNSKIRDNAVLLDTRTNFNSYRNSSIFKIIDRLLSSQQFLELPNGICWEYYFPFRDYKGNESFTSFLRLTMGRPRDIITMMDILKALALEEQRYFTSSDIENPLFLSRYSVYLMTEVKEAMGFIYSENDFYALKTFFNKLPGHFSFTYNEFIEAVDKTINHLNFSDKDIPVFFENENPKDFLQLLFDLNIICYIERKEKNQKFIRWSYQERSTFDPRPEVQIELEYEVHPGLSRALNIGMARTRRK